MKVAFLVFLLCLNFTNGAFAQSNVLNLEDIIAKYPEVGSAAEKQDIDQLLYLQQTRTKAQCDAAELEANASLEVFYGGKKGLLSPSEITRVQKTLRWLTVKTGAKILYYKTKFSRPRPYITHPEIKPCIELEGSKAYPSGHATMARVYARVLAVLFPERSMQFIVRSDEIAHNRVLGGVHHPSDVAAGKKLGDSLADDYLSDNDFRYELETLNL